MANNKIILAGILVLVLVIAGAYVTLSHQSKSTAPKSTSGANASVANSSALSSFNNAGANASLNSTSGAPNATPATDNNYSTLSNGNLIASP